jgi:hypothetical protein
VKTKEDAEKLVHEDWKESRKVIVGEEKKEWRFEVDFRSRDIECIKLPVEYDLGAATFKEPVEATDITSFDDLVQYDPLEVLDYEVHKYEPREIPAFFNYFPTEDTKPLRPGAESEYSIRGVRGDPELGDKKAEDKFIPMPATMQMPLEYKPEKLVVPNPTLRVYVPLEKFSEVDVEHHLRPGVREEKDVLDEISVNHRFVDTEGGFLGLHLPGNVGTRIAARLPTKVADFHVPSLAVRDCTGNFSVAIGYASQLCDKGYPARLVAEDLPIDQFSDSGSDNQNKFELKVRAY